MAEQHYALIKLGEACEKLKPLLTTMPEKRNSIDKYREQGKIDRAKETYAELVSARKRLSELLADIRLLLLEAELADAADYAGNLLTAVNGFDLLTPDYMKFTGAVKVLSERLPNVTTNARIIGRLMNNVKMGYYPTDSAHVDLIKKAVAFPKDRQVNLFDPCCGCGLALERMADGQNARSYGVEIDESRAEEAQSRLNRVGVGSYFHSSISHEAFHFMLLNPPYLSVLTGDGNKARHEKRFLVDAMQNLMYGGVMVYIVPYYRLTADICRVLHDNFSDLSVWRFSDAEFAKFKQVAVFGRRRKRADGSGKVEELLKLSLNPGLMEPLSNIGAGIYHLPEIDKKVSIFKGAEFNVRELADQLKASKSLDYLFKKSALDTMEKRPLLPLNIGQIGLIGGSGLINGLIECDRPHIIKGRIVREFKSNVDEKTDAEGRVISATVTEKRVNRMIFNILTPDGFKQLA
jgi:predicted RNA methylase